MLDERRALIILNPTAGGGRAARWERTLPAAFRRLGWEIEVALTTGPADDRQFAADAARAGWPLIVAVGGDGTVHGVANGLLTVETEAALGVIPAGSGNDFAMLAGFQPLSPDRAAAVLSASSLRRFDVGRVGGEYFVNGLGVGIDTRIIAAMQGIRLPGFARYLVAALKALPGFRPLDARIQADDQSWEGPLTLCEVGIGTRAGGGFLLTPDAAPDDGLFDVCAVGRVGMLRALSYLPKVITGRHVALEPVTMLRCRELRIRVRGVPLLAHLDGEVRQFENGEIHATIEPLRLLVACAA